MTDQWRNEVNKNAMGGTEMMMTKLYEKLGSEFLEPFQIIPSRVRELDPNKIRILYCHDLPQDPESAHLADGGWKRFHAIVFVSNWQQQQYINHYNIPWSRTIVLQNAIEPIKVDLAKRQTKKINLVYHTTPHRGLQLLVPIFQELCKKHDNLHMDVFSSFNIYGWPDRDKKFADLFETINNHENMTYHGTVSNDEVRKTLAKSHIFAYPSIWLETSCISLMEAMSAGLLCVHPNFGALYETAANLTLMYNWDENVNAHAHMHLQMLENAIAIIKEDKTYTQKIAAEKQYADTFYSWTIREHQWKELLNAVRNLPTQIEETGPTFDYKVI